MTKLYTNNSKNLFTEVFAFKCNFLFVNNPSFLKPIHFSVESKSGHIATKVVLTNSTFNLSILTYY